MKRIDARYALWALALLLLVALPLFAGFVGIGWELGQVAGLLGCIGCLLLCGAPLRPRNATPPTLLSLKLHSSIGWAALVATLIHVGGLILTDRLVLVYLKPTAPWYQLAGIVAATLLLLIVLSGVGFVRQRLWKSHRAFQATHVIAGCLLLALIAIHVITTGRYVGGIGRRALLLAAAIGALLLLLRARKTTPQAAPAHAPLRQLVFGRNSRWVLGVTAILGLALTGLLAGASGRTLREPVVPNVGNPLSPHTVLVPLNFPHGKHVAVNCLTCHHNFADGRGMDTCVNCHRSVRSDLKVGVEARFHTFCLECHRHPDSTFEHHGPVSGCSTCHNTDTGTP